MGWIGLGVALCALLCAVLPGLALYFGMGLGILGLGLGAVGYRRRDDAGGARLAGAGAIAVAALALILAGVRYGLILAALDRLQALF
jgi:hypothetical protein